MNHIDIDTPDLAINAWWPRLAATSQRGIHVLDEASGGLNYCSYAELYRQASIMSSVLAAKGISRGDAVLLSAETSPVFPVLWLALMWLGAVPVPLPPVSALPGQNTFFNRIRHILPHFHHYLHGADEGPEIKRAIQACQARLACWRIDQLREEAMDTLGLAPEPVELASQDLAFVQYTSGSTSAPKGIRITYGNLLHNIQGMSRRLQLNAHVDTFISWLPLYHDMGLIGKLLQSMLTQTNLVLVSPHAFVKHPLRFLSLIEAHQGSICSMPNFAYELLLKRAQPDVPIPNLRSMRWFGVGAEPVRINTTTAFSQRFEQHGLRPGVVSPCYGLAEATLAVSIDNPLQGYQTVQLGDARHATCGRPLDGFDVRIDPDSRALLIRGESVASTALVNGEIVSLLDGDGYYNTKDVARLEEGRLVILGRVDEMFVVNGENRFPYDIEAAVRSVCGETTRAACFQLPRDAGRGKAEVIVVYERKAEQASMDDDIQEAIHGAVLSHTGLRIDQVVAVDFKTLPVTPSGKIQRIQARQHYLLGHYQAERESLVI